MSCSQLAEAEPDGNFWEHKNLYEKDVEARDRQMSDLLRQMKGYRLTTAEILYHRPDHPALLQSYVWQEYDIAPRFPVLNKFLHFWESNLDGKLHSVWVAATGIIAPAELKYSDGQFTLQ